MQFTESPQEGSGEFLRIKSGPENSIVGVFRGQPLIFYTHWVDTDQGRRTRLCTQPAECRLCDAGNKKTFTFRLNFIMNDAADKKDPKMVCRIWEQKTRVYNQLKGLSQGGYDLERILVRITRSGSGTDTSYSIIPVPNGAVNETQEAKIRVVKLLDLAPQPQQDSPTETSPMDDIPF